MFGKLSASQRVVALEKTGQFVVRACPGSGKTFSVAARMANLILGWQNRSEGVAALSFTNVAWQEISEMLDRGYGIQVPITHPHFLGTIDSFINQYVFLPFGHLIMNCPERPILVGEPHGQWTFKRYANDYDQYFDDVSLGINDELIYPEIHGMFFFGHSKFMKKNGEESQHATSVRAVKAKYWSLGYATQKDANYFTLRLLQKYPKIAQAIVQRFPIFIIDEAQDTNTIQMAIIDTLIQHGLREVLLIGDPDQAIFEWNDAKPDLFIKKFEEWKDNSVVLNENRRSSQNICNTTFNLSSLNSASNAMGTTAGHKHLPTIIEYDPDNIAVTIQEFLDTCRKQEIELTRESVVVTFRSKSFIGSILGMPPQAVTVWIDNDYHTRDFAEGKYLFEKGNLKESFRLIERGMLKLLLKSALVTRIMIDDYVAEFGLFPHRVRIMEVINRLPSTNCSLAEWIEMANLALAEFFESPNLQFDNAYTQIFVDTLFPKHAISQQEKYPVTVGTIHSIKGETYDATLVFLKEKVHFNYRTLLQKNVAVSDDEELRIVYVGLTRPRKLLVLAVPNLKDKEAWTQRLFKNG